MEKVVIALSRVEPDAYNTSKSSTIILPSTKRDINVDDIKLAYIDSEGDLIVIDEFDSKVLIALERVKTPADVTYQIWRLTTKNNYSSKALKQAIEIMSKKVGIMSPMGDWTYVGNG
ncbi:hypothetical protein [Enterobacter asburiae]|uniref:hypothetical protein n=1 Tax=Enterobacter asburiae TaxID=61645 RepID=UPI0030172A21